MLSRDALGQFVEHQKRKHPQRIVSILEHFLTNLSASKTPSSFSILAHSTEARTVFSALDVLHLHYITLSSDWRIKC